MHRAMLQDILPWLFWLIVAGAATVCLVQFGGGRWNWRRLSQLARCETGAVQSLSLVMTLPVFLLLMLFIVQVTQVIMAIMLVHYSAFAGARAAAVWMPANVTGHDTFYDMHVDERLFGAVLLEPANVVSGPQSADEILTQGIGRLHPFNSATSLKYQKVRMAALIPCVTLSPSRGQTGNLPSELQPLYQSLLKVYPTIDPASRKNAQMPQRLRNKLQYAAEHTTVEVIWQNVPHPMPDIVSGPTYNPWQHPSPRVPRWNPNEVGFRDPVTVVVRHQYALLPGIGRILSKRVSMPDGQEDQTATRINGSGNNEYTMEIKASATFINEGYKSIYRYAIHP